MHFLSSVKSTFKFVMVWFAVFLLSFIFQVVRLQNIWIGCVSSKM